MAKAKWFCFSANLSTPICGKWTFQVVRNRGDVTCKRCLRLIDPRPRFDKLVRLLKDQKLIPDIQLGLDGSTTVTCEATPTFKAVFYNFKP